MMAIAAWLVWRTPASRARSIGLYLYVFQLALNALWSWVFFSWRLGFWAIVEIAILWIFIIGTLLMFYRVKRMAGLLLAPYLVWVSFAAALTISLWQLNPNLLG